MFCEVCNTEVQEHDSVFILEKTLTTKVPMIFKFFQVIQRELSFSGVVCKECRNLCEKMDLLESQFNAVQNDLKKREYHHQDFKDFSEQKIAEEPFIDPPLSDVGTSIVKDLECLDKGRVDTEFKITKTQRKEESLLVYKGHTFRKVRQSYVVQDVESGLIHWRCAKHHLKDNPCRSKVATSGDGLYLLLDSYTNHNHSANFSSCAAILLRERIKTITLNHPNLKTHEILASADMLDANSGSKKLKDDKSLHRYVQRLKIKMRTK